MSNLKTLAERANVSMVTAYRALSGTDSVDAEAQRKVAEAALALDYTLNVTIRDVAALAGVSVGTVSHVLNNSTLTKPETRQRVLQAINELNYKPNSIARGLKSNQTRLIGYGWHSPEDPVRRNALLDRFLYDMAQAAESWGYHILTFAQPDRTSITRYEELIQTVRIDGLVLTDITYDDYRVNYLMKMDVPFVGFGCTDPRCTFPCVDVDGRAGMRLVVEHLLARGHERIGLLCWPEGMRIGDIRTQGFMDGLQAAGVPIREQWIARTHNTVEEAYVAAKKIMSTSPRPTAIACTNDVMAFGVRRYLEEAGLQIGIDVAVAGYDDTPVADLLGLTSVRQPIDMVAAKVIEILIGEVQGTPVARRCVLLEPTLVVRSSSRNQRG
jgi:DNA-binding LacI/PurR family transcriptional regulator